MNKVTASHAKHCVDTRWWGQRQALLKKLDIRRQTSNVKSGTQLNTVHALIRCNRNARKILNAQLNMSHIFIVLYESASD